MDPVTALVEQALAAPSRPELLRRAAALACCVRDRQVVAVAAAYLRGDDDRAVLLGRDHLADHPDSVLVARICSLTLTREELR